MSEWPMVKLGELGKWAAGGTPSRLKAEYFGGIIPWASIADLNDGFVSMTMESITELGLQNSSAKIYPKGSILIAMYGSIGKLGINVVPMASNQAIACFIPNETLERDYAFWALYSLRSELIMIGRGGTQKNIGQGILKEQKIPLPPLGEQKRIAEILGGVSKAIQKTKVQLLLVDILKENKYLSLSKDADTFKSLKDLGVKKITGKSIVAKPDNEHDINQIIKVSAVSSGRFIASETKPLPADYEPNNLHEIHQGDLLFARASGSANLLGACCIVDKEIQHLYLPDKVWKLEVNEDILPKVYLLQALRGREFRSVAESHFSSSTGVKNIKTSVLMEFKIPVLKQDQLNDYVHFVKTLDNLRYLLHRKLSLLQELQKSLATRAFAGLL